MRDEDSVAQLISKCWQEIRSKGVQYSGGDSIEVKPSFGTKSITIGAGKIATMLVTFTASKQLNALAELTWTNNLLFETRKILTPKDSNVTQFEIDIQNTTGSTVTYTMNLVVISTDSGVIT